MLSVSVDLIGVRAVEDMDCLQGRKVARPGDLGLARVEREAGGPMPGSKGPERTGMLD